MRELSLRLAPEHEEFRQEFRAWLAENAPGRPVPEDQDEMYAYQRSWHQTLHRDGWAGIDWPIEFGGRAASPVQKFVYYDELAAAPAPRLLNQPALILVGPTIMVHGSARQKKEYLPRIISAEDIWCQGFSEPEAGSDLAGLRTSARLDGDRWIINGQKTWTTWAKYSDWCALMCRTNPDAPKHRGLSMLIVDMRQPGVEVRPITMMTGRQEFCEVYFTDAVADADAVIGEVDAGWAAAMTMLEFERSDQSFTDHARLRPLLTQLETLVATPAARERLVELWSRYHVMRELNLHTALTLEAGNRVGAEGSVMKLYWSELYQDIGSLAADVIGPDALEHNAWTEFYLEGRAATIYSGTSEIQRNIIAERVAGLPRI